jgi:hypothetical protein
MWAAEKPLTPEVCESCWTVARLVEPLLLEVKKT